ncbi:hypothetical protein [Nisaea sp.]
MSRRKITVFYAWQSDRPQNINRHFIRNALDEAAQRITEDAAIDAEVLIDVDTEGEVGTPPVTETILRKIAAADIFVPDLTFVARAEADKTKTEADKLIPNPNVMIEYGYALKALSLSAMMPVMNTHYGLPKELPFDMRHIRHPTQYSAAPEITKGLRRELREKLSMKLEENLRLMIQNVLSRPRTDSLFVPEKPKRSPAFFFNSQEVLVNFGHPGEPELRFERDRAIYIRLFPTYADQPRVGRTKAMDVAPKLKPPIHLINSPRHLINSPSGPNYWGAINLETSGNGITAFTQVFENGELWGVSEEPFDNSVAPNTIIAIRAERGFVEALENYWNVYEKVLKLRPPFKIEFGATGLKNHLLLVPSAEFGSSGDYAGPIQRDSISHTYQLSSFDWPEWESALRAFLIEFYDSAGRDRAEVLTEQHIEGNNLPPI